VIFPMSGSVMPFSGVSMRKQGISIGVGVSAGVGRWRWGPPWM
jgi:hypothetical protein